MMSTDYTILALSISITIALAIQPESTAECISKCEWDTNSKGFMCESSQCNTFPHIAHTSVKEIYLARNNISAIPSDFSFPNLQLLDLAHNSFQELSNGAFHNSMSLRVLDLSHNFLHNLENGEFRHLSWLEDLELHHNRLREIDESFFKDLIGLKSLDLSHNDIVFVEYTSFKWNRRLKNLTLDYNKLTELDYQTFTHNLQLEHLSLEGNLITELRPAMFVQQLHLSYLNLRNNHLVNIQPGVLSDLTRLEVLDLEGNYLQHAELSGIPHLKDLNLDRNTFGVIGSNTLTLPKSLQNISISRCLQLRRVDEEAFSGLIHLKSVTIEGNPQLSSIAYNIFDRMTELEYLSLKNNALFSLAPHVMSAMTSSHTALKRIHLGGNPWNCDCHMTWVKHLQLPDEYKQEFKCATPHAVEGRLLTNIDINELSCPSHIGMNVSRRTGIILVLTASLVVILLSFLLIAYSRRMCRRRTDNMAYRALYNTKDRSSSAAGGEGLAPDHEQQEVLRSRMMHA